MNENEKKQLEYIIDQKSREIAHLNKQIERYESSKSLTIQLACMAVVITLLIGLAIQFDEWHYKAYCGMTASAASFLGAYAFVRILKHGIM